MGGVGTHSYCRSVGNQIDAEGEKDWLDLEGKCFLKRGTLSDGGDRGISLVWEWVTRPQTQVVRGQKLMKPKIFYIINIILY